MTQEALKLALEALEDRSSLMKWQIARDAVKEALAQQDSVQAKPEPEQEPVISKWVLREVYFDEDGEPIIHRSTPQRTWVGLTWEDANEIATAHDVRPSTVKAIEAKLKQKNGYAEEKT